MNPLENLPMKEASKSIRFIDSNYRELFRIPDGGCIRITLSTGEQLDRSCRYIDDYHTQVGGRIYHICEFAEIMERNGNTVQPLNDVEKNELPKKTQKNRDYER